MCSNLPQQPKNAFEQHLQKAKIEFLPDSVKFLLEIGCGDGSVFDGSRFTCDGYDIDQDSLEICRESKNYRLVSDELTVFDPADYDCVAILGTLEHMEEEDIVYLLDYLKSSKSVYVTVPNANSFHRHVGKHLGIINSLEELSEQDFSIGHKRYYNIDLLKAHLWPLYHNGFKEVISGSAGFKISSSRDMIVHLPIIKSVEQVSEKTGLIGIKNFLGAELFVYLSR